MNPIFANFLFVPLEMISVNHLWVELSIKLDQHLLNPQYFRNQVKCYRRQCTVFSSHTSWLPHRFPEVAEEQVELELEEQVEELEEQAEEQVQEEPQELQLELLGRR